jgi:hypothetical protein
MEINRPDGLISGLLIAADMFNHRSDIGFKVGNKLGYFVKPFLKGIKAGPQGSPVGCHLPISSQPRATDSDSSVRGLRRRSTVCS